MRRIPPQAAAGDPLCWRLPKRLKILANQMQKVPYDVVIGLRVPLYDILESLSDAIDLASPIVANHNKQVAYIATCVAEELGFSAEEQRELALAGMLHDIGILSLKERLASLQFDDDGACPHAERGYRILRMFQPLSPAATLIRFHHVPWNQGAGVEFEGELVPTNSHVLHLADRVAVLLKPDQAVFKQARNIIEKVAASRGELFPLEVVEAFLSLAKKECFWLDVTSPGLNSVLRRKVVSKTLELDLAELISLAKVCARIIDFKCPATATHSSCVAAVAEAVATIAGFSGSECQQMKVAGYLHDLGKPAVPTEILQKPASLVQDEFDIIRSHPFYTYRILERIQGFDHINAWASYHHERLDGHGYPFHLKDQEIPVGARIMAVADVFTALTEDRPYRRALSGGEALRMLKEMAADLAVDGRIVSLFRPNLDYIDQIRANAQAPEYEMYQETMLT